VNAGYHPLRADDPESWRGNHRSPLQLRCKPLMPLWTSLLPLVMIARSAWLTYNIKRSRKDSPTALSRTITRAGSSYSVRIMLTGLCNRAYRNRDSSVRGKKLDRGPHLLLFWIKT